MTRKPTCPGSPRARNPESKGSGGHYWELDGPYDVVSHTGGRVSKATRGRTCHWCHQREPDFEICATVVATTDGRWTSHHRCNARGTLRSKLSAGMFRDRFQPIDGDGYAYCKTHHPETQAAKALSRPLTQWDRDTLRWKKEALLREAVARWHADELATEGFCPDDERCEHHACRLHRVLVALDAPTPANWPELEAAKAGLDAL